MLRLSLTCTSGMSEETSTQTAVASIFTETRATNHQVQTSAKSTCLAVFNIASNDLQSYSHANDVICIALSAIACM